MPTRKVSPPTMYTQCTANGWHRCFVDTRFSFWYRPTFYYWISLCAIRCRQACMPVRQIYASVLSSRISPATPSPASPPDTAGPRTQICNQTWLASVFSLIFLLAGCIKHTSPSALSSVVLWPPMSLRKISVLVTGAPKCPLSPSTL